MSDKLEEIKRALAGAEAEAEAGTWESELYLLNHIRWLVAEVERLRGERDEARAERDATKAYMVDLDMWHEKAKSEREAAQTEAARLREELEKLQRKERNCSTCVHEYLASEMEPCRSCDRREFTMYSPKPDPGEGGR